MNVFDKIGLRPWNGTSFFIAIAGMNALLMVLCSYKLWSSVGRSFYKVPLLPFELPTLLDIPLFILLLIGLLGVLFFKNKKGFMLLSLLVFMIFILLDIHRLQIWVYQTMLIFGVPFLAKQEKQQFRLWAVILGGTYLWAGLHKINFAFLEVVYPWFMGTYQFTKPLIAFKYLAVFPILIEVSLGVLILLSGRWLRYAFWLSVLFHAGILFFLGPWGSGWNFIVYPWNLLSPLLVFCLYKSQKYQRKVRKFTPAYGLYVLLCLLLPALYIFNLYPANLSFSLYTGKSDFAFFTTYDTNGNIKKQENIGEWANKELYIPHFKSDWVHQKMAEKHIQVMDDSIPRGLLIVKYLNPVFSKKRKAFETKLSNPTPEN